MSSKNKTFCEKFAGIGDSGLIDDEIYYDEVLEILENCKVVEASVRDGDFSLDEAKKAYGVTDLQYVAYLQGQVKPKI